jgi:hypothetical protein
MNEIVDEVEGLYQVITFEDFRKTPGVTFNVLPQSIIALTDSLDRVLHEKKALSPGPIGDVIRPWYMHDFQDDNLVVLYGTRDVDIYSPAHGQVEHFTVTANDVYKNGQLITTSGAMLVWPKGVFHRIVSGEEGSASINLAIHYEGWNVKSNFNIYDVDTVTGQYRLIREGFKDQM